jgi:hypothetical protein
VHDNAHAPFAARLGLRLLGRPSADRHDVGARLDRALSLASCTSEGRAPVRARPVQVVGEAHHDPEAYRRWRERQRRRASGAAVPQLLDGEWALVLWAVPPAALMDFLLKRDTAALLAPPLVGRFTTEVTDEVGLAATLASWLTRRYEIVLAPPLLADGDAGPYRVATLRRGWPQAPAERRDLLGEGDPSTTA